MNEIEQRVKGLEVEVGNLKKSVDTHGEKLERGLIMMTQHDGLLEQVKTSFQNHQQVRDETKENSQRSRANRKMIFGLFGIGSGGIYATIRAFLNGG